MRAKLKIDGKNVYIKFNKREIFQQKEISLGNDHKSFCVLDYDKDGNVVGIEILNMEIEK